jgi:hypothetical protein
MVEDIDGGRNRGKINMEEEKGSFRKSRDA